jgi:hypothetical protein
MLLAGDRDFLVTVRPPVTPQTRALLEGQLGKHVQVKFFGRTPLRRVLRAVTSGSGAAGNAVRTPESASDPALKEPAQTLSAPPEALPIDLTDGRPGAAPLWLLPNGCFALSPDLAPMDMDARPALIRAARWISSRRTSTFERLFPPSAFHPEIPIRPEKSSLSQAEGLLKQVQSVLRAAAAGGAEAQNDVLRAGEARSGALTVLSHMIATVLKDPSWREMADSATAEIFAFIEAEHGETAIAALRAHAIHLLQLRGPALRPEAQQKAVRLVRSLLREAPPYQDLSGPWRFALCSASDFHEGECEILVERYGFREIPAPEDTPAVSGRHGQVSYKVFEAPFRTPEGNPIRLFARVAFPEDENTEMGYTYFTGMLINRHAQLGSYDLKASALSVLQVGYKLMMNAQCAGLTTRFAISRLFPDADIYSSWDSTYFRTERGKMNASEGVDCFVALLTGMSRHETHAQIDERMRRAQWHHPQSAAPTFSQFIGPAHPLVVARMSDINQDGRADLYDGYLDLRLSEIAEDLRASSTPRDPGVAASQISGEAALGLNWAAGSLNRVTQYSDIWANLPGETELLYAFQSAGFYDHLDPPADVPQGQLEQALGRLPAVCRFQKQTGGKMSFVAEVMLHSHLCHAGKEYKRVLCAAEAIWRAFDLGYFAGDPQLETLLSRRCAVLLMLAGLLEFPAEQNFIDGLWATALKTLQFPEISRSVVRACMTDEDLQQSLEQGDPVIWAAINSPDPRVGRSGEMTLGESPATPAG